MRSRWAAQARGASAPAGAAQRRSDQRKRVSQSAVSSGGFFDGRRGAWASSMRRSNAAVLDADLDDAALGQLAEQQLFGQRLLDVLLDHAAQRTRAHLVVIALVGQPFGGGVWVSSIVHVAVHQLRLELQDELLDHLQDDLLRQRRRS